MKSASEYEWAYRSLEINNWRYFRVRFVLQYINNCRTMDNIVVRLVMVDFFLSPSLSLSLLSFNLRETVVRLTTYRWLKIPQLQHCGTLKPYHNNRQSKSNQMRSGTITFDHEMCISFGNRYPSTESKNEPLNLLQFNKYNMKMSVNAIVFDVSIRNKFTPDLLYFCALYLFFSPFGYLVRASIDNSSTQCQSCESRRTWQRCWYSSDRKWNVPSNIKW